MATILALATDLPPVEGHVDGDVVEEAGVLYILQDGHWLSLDQIAPVLETRVQSTPLGARPGSDVVTADVVTSDDIKRQGARTLADVLRQQPGIQVSSSLGLGEEVTMDGLDGKHVLILVDGRPVIGKVNNRVDVSRIPVSAESIKKIEIVRGPMSAVYGSEAMGGVINIITKRPSSTPQGDAGVAERVGMGGYHDEAFSTRLSAGRGPIGASVEATATESSTLDRPAVLSKGGAGDANGALPERRELGARADLRLLVDEATTIRAYASATNATSKSVPAPTIPFSDQNTNGQLEGGVRYERDLGDGHDFFVDIRASRFQHYFEKVSDQASALKTDTAQTDARIEARYTAALVEHAPFAEELSAAVGAVVDRESVHRVDGDGNDGVPGANARLLPAGYAELLWLPAPWLSLSPGVRADGFLDGIAGEGQRGGALSPKVALKLELPATIALRASYGEGFRLPTFEERFLFFDHSELGYVVEGNPQLEPERSHGGRASVSFSPSFAGVKLDAGVDGFLNLLENLITETTLSRTTDAGVPIFSYVNAARAVTAGVDASVGLELPWNVELDASYQWLALATDASSCPDENPWFCGADEGARTLPLRPTHSLHATASWRLGVTDTTLFLRADALDQRVIDATTTAPGYVDLGVGVTQELFSHVELLVAADNLLDAYDPTFGPKPGRTARAQLRGYF